MPMPAPKKAPATMSEGQCTPTPKRLNAISDASKRPHGAVLGKKHNTAKAAAKALAACKLGMAPESAMGTNCRTVSGMAKHGRIRPNQGLSSRAPKKSVVARAQAKANSGLHACALQRQSNQQATTPRQNTAIHREDKATQNNSRGRHSRWLKKRRISSSNGRR